MTRWRISVANLLLCLGSVLGAQRPAGGASLPYTHVVPSLQAVASSSGRPTLLLVLRVEDGWHLSYRNPGETGLPTRMTWTLPAGVQVARDVWPVPRVTRTDVGVTHTLEGEVPWLIEFDAPPSVDERLVSLTIRYGVCREVCIPAQLAVQGALPGTSTPSLPSIPAPLRAKLLRDGGRLSARRVRSGRICVRALPFASRGTTRIDVLADTTAMIPVSIDDPTPGADIHDLFMNSSDTSAFAPGRRFVFVRGDEGVSVRLDFPRDAPRCPTR